MSENIHTQPKGRKAVLVILVSLAHETENKTREELAAEIRKALEAALARIPWVVLNSVIIVEE